MAGSLKRSDGSEPPAGARRPATVRAMGEASMREFWDARASENPFFFVDNEADYRDPDEAAFWAEGPNVVDGIEEILGFHISNDDRIVEIGCGIGRLTRVLAARTAHVVALDVSPQMLARARELNPNLDNVDWTLGDGASLAGIPSESADGCFSFVTFQHIPDPDVTLEYVREIARVLRPGGWAAFQLSTMSEVWRPNIVDRVRLGLRAMVGRGPRGQSNPAWVGSSVPEPKLRHEAARAGLETKRLMYGGTLYSAVLATKTGSKP